MIHRCYAWGPELKGCQTQGKTVEETLTDIRKAIELFLETPTDEERSEALRHEILTTAVPRLIAADVEARAGEMRQELIKEPAQEGQGVRMVGRQSRRVAHISTARAFIRLGDLGQLLQRRILQPVSQVAERILVRH